MVKDLLGNFKLSPAEAMLPLSRIPALALLDFTQPLQFYLKVESIIMMTIFILHLGAPVSVSGVLGCLHSLTLYFTHMAAHERIQLKKSVSCIELLRGW